MKKSLARVLVLTLVALLFPAINSAGARADAFVSPPGLEHIADGPLDMAFKTVNSKTYFNGFSSLGTEGLWVTDGTAQGTREIANTEGFVSVYELTPWDDGVAFLGVINGEAQIVTSDGTTVGSRALDLTGTGIQASSGLFAFANRLYFNDTSGYLAYTDGTIEGTARTNIQYATFLGVSNGKIYFTLVRGGFSGELYSYDGTNTPQQISGISGDAQGATGFQDLTQVGTQTLFFAAQDTVGGDYRSLFVTDGTAAGTHYLYPAYGLSSIPPFSSGTNDDFGTWPVRNGFAYFVADHHLWRSDGTSNGTTEYGFSGSGQTGYLNFSITGAFAGNILTFATDLGDGRGIEVQGLDTATGRIFGISDFYPGAASSNPDNFVSLNGGVLFNVGNEIWSFTPALSSTPLEIPDPPQQSSVLPITTTLEAGTSNSLVVTGTFREDISSIQVNGQPLAKGSWAQSPNSLSITLAPLQTGRLVIQIFDGSVPVLPEQIVLVTPKDILAPTTPSAGPAHGSTRTLKPKVKYLECLKGFHMRVVRGIAPICPDGFLIKT